jgi:ankyrin repeat protein
LNTNSDPIDFEIDDHTALTWAVRWRRRDLIELLVNHGADPGQVTRGKNLIFRLISYNDSVEMLEYLIKNGVDVS